MDFRFQGSSAGPPKVVNEFNSEYTKYTLSYPCTNNYTCSPYTATLIPGKYKFELYGAAGGSTSNNKGGKGGFSVGYYVNNISTEAYFFIGGKGEDGPKYHNTNANTPGGFNGGGYGGYDSGHQTDSGGGGGGSTDIRIASDQIEKRIIVAAGGGGACYDSNCAGGNAGGTKGSDGKIYNAYNYGKIGGGATDKAGGSAYTGRNAKAGQLFYGGSASTMYNAYGGGGGGSGYYGGGGGSSSIDHGAGHCGSGGGGSGYIGGVSSSDILRITAETKESSNEGNGYMIITYFGSVEFNNGIRCISNVCRCRMRTDAFLFIASFIIIGK